MQYFDNNDDLRSELKVLNYNHGKYNFKFTSDLGVFSKNKIDEGSKLLVETYIKYGNKNISLLDVGCGIGFIGIVLSKIMNVKCDMIDVNNRALHLSKMNVKNNDVNINVIKSDVYDSITSSYDVIISNPPIRAGKNVYLKIINDSFNYMNDKGELWFVMRTNHGVKTVIKNLREKYVVDVLEKSCGFYIVRVKKS